MNKLTLLSLVVLLFSLVIGIGYVGYNQFYMIDSLSKDLHLVVGDVIGINLDTDAIYFGTTYPGGTSKRAINISNNYNFPIIASINTEGELAKFVSVSENNFIVEPHTSKKVTFYAETKKDTEKKTYEGTATIVFKRVLFEQ